MFSFSRHGIRSTTGRGWRSWLYPTFFVVAGLAAAVVYWFWLDRGTTTVYDPYCWVSCYTVVPRVPAWERWGLPISCLMLGLGMGALSAVKYKLHYRLMLRNLTTSKKWLRRTSQCDMVERVLMYFGSVVAPAAGVCVAVGIIASFIVVK